MKKNNCLRTILVAITLLLGISAHTMAQTKKLLLTIKCEKLNTYIDLGIGGTGIDDNNFICDHTNTPILSYPSPHRTDHDGYLRIYSYCKQGTPTAKLTTFSSMSNHNLISIEFTADCASLKTLGLSGNKLTSLDLTNCTGLTELYCSGNRIETLNVSGRPQLFMLVCFDNHLTTLNLSGCSALQMLDCSINYLTTLNLSGCTALTNLVAQNQKISVSASGGVYKNPISYIPKSGTELVTIGGTYSFAYNATLPSPASGNTLKFTTLKTASANANNVFSGTITLEGYDAPPVVSNNTITVGAVTHNSIAISWTKATDVITPQNQLKYEMMIGKSSAAGLYTVETLTDANSYIFTGLDPNTDYNIGVKVVDGSGKSEYYDDKSNIKTLAGAVDNTPPSLPTNKTVRVTNIRSTTATVSWDAASDNVTATGNLKYTVYSETGTAVTLDYLQHHKNHGSVTGATTLNITRLTPETYHDINVVVEDAAGNKTLYSAAWVSTTATDVSVTNVTVAPTTLALQVGQNETLIPTVVPSNATNKAVTWSSSSTSIATVSNGVVTAHAAGSATITVTTIDGSKKATCAVTVTAAPPTTIAVTGISLNKATTTIVAGNTETLTATVSPANATNKSVNWSNSNPAVATVSGGVVTAISAGATTITVASVSDPTKMATCNVTVTAAPATTVAVTGITLNKTSATIVVGKTETLTATVAPANATNKSVNWSSSNPAAATVSGGVVTTVSAGSTTITATTVDGGKTATCTVTVKTDDVGIEQVGNATLSAYPNPTDGMLTVTGLTPGTTVHLYNIVGTQVSTYTAEAETITIDLSPLAFGMYFLNIDGRTIKIIKN